MTMMTTLPKLQTQLQFTGKRRDDKRAKKKAIEDVYKSQLPEQEAEENLNRVESLQKQLEEAQQQLAEKLEALPELKNAELPAETIVLLNNVDEKKLKKFVLKQFRKTIKLSGEDKGFLGIIGGASALVLAMTVVMVPFLIPVALLCFGVTGNAYMKLKNGEADLKMGNVKPERYARLMLAEGVMTVDDLKKMQKKG